MTLSRRSFLAASTAMVVFARPDLAQAAVETPFTHETVVQLARELSSKKYKKRPAVPDDWINLSYDQYRDIRFPRGNALWADTDRSYNVDFFAPGLYFPHATKVYTVANGMATPVDFNLDLFDKGKLVPDLTKQHSALGFSGFRLRTDLGHPEYKTEYCVFQGASYFRAIGLAQTYGLSARGLAIKTGDPMGEEFPDFTHFWLEAPGSDQENMVVHALMDSPSVTGAYRFDIRPGADCVMDVDATLFPRVEMENVGIGPLTSMFLYDETNRSRFDDFRPAVHDSDGLMMWNGNGEMIWRPLANPVALEISSFVDNNPRGFGLMQRARKLSDFADLEALYHNRPGLWVEPKGDWGRGTVTLVEIPTDQEIFDNIVAYWRPSEPLQPGEQTNLSYRLTWGEDAPVRTDMPRVIQTAMGEKHWGDGRVVVIDFEAHPLFADGPDAMTVVTRSPHVETTEGVLQRNPETGGLRLAFSFDPGERNHVELRAQLRKDGKMASEVWLYRWTS
ncbi:MAG: glucan biosynthesis protein G [Pseudomonadota bacterium]